MSACCNLDCTVCPAIVRGGGGAALITETELVLGISSCALLVYIFHPNYCPFLFEILSYI